MLQADSRERGREASASERVSGVTCNKSAENERSGVKNSGESGGLAGSVTPSRRRGEERRRSQEAAQIRRSSSTLVGKSVRKEDMRGGSQAEMF